MSDPLSPSTSAVASARPELDFVIGQDEAGRWLAVETHGAAGGVFVSRDAAFRFVAGECGRRRDAIRVSGGRVRLRF